MFASAFPYFEADAELGVVLKLKDQKIFNIFLGYQPFLKKFAYLWKPQYSLFDLLLIFYKKDVSIWFFKEKSNQATTVYGLVLRG